MKILGEAETLSTFYTPKNEREKAFIVIFITLSQPYMIVILFEPT